jgi:hypothetical protein
MVPQLQSAAPSIGTATTISSAMPGTTQLANGVPASQSSDMPNVPLSSPIAP